MTNWELKFLHCSKRLAKGDLCIIVLSCHHFISFDVLAMMIAVVLNSLVSLFPLRAWILIEVNRPRLKINNDVVYNEDLAYIPTYFDPMWLTNSFLPIQNWFSNCGFSWRFFLLVYLTNGHIYESWPHIYNLRSFSELGEFPNKSFQYIQMTNLVTQSHRINVFLSLTIFEQLLETIDSQKKILSKLYCLDILHHCKW